MQTAFLSRIVNRELYTLLSSVAVYPVYRGYQYPENTALPASLFYMEQSAWDTGGHTVPAEHLTAGQYRFVVRTDGEGSSDTVIAEEAQRLVDAVAGQIIDTADGYQVTFRATGETPVTSMYQGAQQYQRLGVIYEVTVT